MSAWRSFPLIPWTKWIPTHKMGHSNNNREQLYRALCQVLSGLSTQVDWPDYTQEDWACLAETAGKGTIKNLVIYISRL